MSTRLKRVHWPHLALLAVLPAWFAVTRGLAPELRLAGWLAIAFAVLGVSERLLPFRRDWQADQRGLRRDATVLSLNTVVDSALGATLAAVASRWPGGESAWPLSMQVLAGLALGELLAYAMHRASHGENWLWRVHVLHHRPERLNVANALTAHPLNAAWDKLAHVLPMLVLGFGEEAVVAVTLFTLTQGLVVHANVAGTIGPLNLLLGSAELHRLHHGIDERQAGNYGTAVPWWDLVFGTFRSRAVPAAVGVYAPARYPGEHAVTALLALPFTRHRGSGPTEG